MWLFAGARARPFRPNEENKLGEKSYVDVEGD